MKPKMRVTLADIAAAAGVTKATVSLALNDAPRISESTRERIKTLAHDMGYSRDPAVDTLMRQVRQGRVDAHHETIAVISFDNPHAPHSVHTSLLEGAQERATELGFSIEAFHFGELDMTPKAFSDVLLARGVRAVLLLPPNQYGYRFELTWEAFTTISFGYQFAHPECDRILSNHAHGVWLALTTLRDKGYRKLGFVTDSAADEETTAARIAMYDRHMAHQSVNERIPILKDSRAHPLSASDFKVWFDRYEPDVIIGRAQPLDLLADLGLRVPEDRGFVSLAAGGTVSHCSGIRVPNRALGASAIETLAENLYLNKLGLPSRRKTILVDCEWVDGDTLA